MTEPHAELRASDADREHAVDWLRRAAGDGQLTVDELDARLHEAYTARTRGALASLTADLQPAGGAVRVPAASPGAWTVRRGEGGARWLLAILSGCDRAGRWRLAERCTALTLMGSTELELTQVELAEERVELRVLTLMGGAEIRVPSGLRVEVSQLAILGGNSVDLAEEAVPAPGPVLRLRLLSLMGGAEVTRGPTPTRTERKTPERRTEPDG